MTVDVRFFLQNKRLIKLAGAAALLTISFVLGLRWQKPVPPLVVSETPRQAVLEIKSSDGALNITAPEDTLVSINDDVAKAGQSLSASWQTGPVSIKWWSPDWATQINLGGQPPVGDIVEHDQDAPGESGKFVASSGGKKYHPAENCRYADSIKPENIIFFETTDQAEAAGYEPSSCFK